MARGVRAASAVGALAAALAVVPAAPPAGAADVRATATSGLDYVALGSSFAAGPGIPPVQSSGGAVYCGRSDVNYPALVARDIGANLTDVSCSGATTAHLLTEKQSEQPPQLQAVTDAARVVTITIGGNDVDYLGSINAYSCLTGGGSGCRTVDRGAIDETFGVLTDRLESVVTAVRAAAPQARVYLVSYFTILPDSGVCADVPLTADQAAFERSIASRLAAATADAATAAGAALVDLAAASRGHDACSAAPWVESYRPASGRSTYHPNEAGMKAAAGLVESALAASGQLRTSEIRSGVPGKCVDVAGSGTADGTAVQLYGCNGTGAQKWTYAPGAGGTLRALGGCLDVSGGATADRTKVQLWRCNGTDAQRWVPGPDSSLVNPRSGRCLDDPAGSSADRTRLQIYECNGSRAQRWTLAG
ncbi:ricin-type beta-trefoil lectin domain protein [Streptomyces sp. CRN 30]|uniref:ricin-type beta-trefoil lectin domain protein n=1 Tax=Streptomyces sp. CRN 30 TaxID=3075613 RepID=UPI002A82E6C7|nr:ricin-type beta-trefoil lectin domain protein [Streptomyces sp. CRN 30]